MPTQRTWNASGRAKFIARRTRNGMARFRMVVARTQQGMGRVKFVVYRVRQGMARFRMVVYRKMSSAGRFVLVAPVLPPLAVFIGGVLVPIQQNALSYDRRIDDSASGSFTVEDSGAEYDLAENRTVMIFDSQSSITLYRGFIDRVDESLVPGSSTTNMRTVTLKDLRWLAEKRIWTGDEFPDWTSGDIAAELHRTILVNEGISAAYALRHDMDATSFGAGTLSGVAVNPLTGELELAKAGSTFTKIETTTADFATGTLSNVTASSNQLALTSYQAIKLSGTSGKSVGYNGGNLFTYWAIWTGAQSVVTGDYLEFDIWVSSTSVEISGGVDLTCSDGTTFRDSGAIDQFGIDCHPKASLEGYANDQWMHRVIVVPASWNGKTINVCRVAFESDKEGPSTLYVKAINFRSSGGTLKTAFFSTTLQKASQSSNVGYLNVKLAKVTVYAQSGSRISPAYGSISATIAGNSLITWNQVIPTQPTTQGTQDIPSPLTVESSLDGGASWQLCTNHTAIPSLLIGQNLSGKTLMLRETFNVAGPNPELTPVLSDVTLSIEPAYTATKTDILHADAASAMTTGTIVNSGYQAAFDPVHDLSGYQLSGKRKRWNWAQFGDTTTFGTMGVRGTGYGSLYLRADPTTETIIRFDGATYSAVALEVDVQAPNIGANVGGSAVLYRTTNWDNTPNSWAYCVHINQSQLVLTRGSNTAGSNAPTTLNTVTINLNIGDWYHLKVVCGSDNVHHIFLDDIEYITTTDATFTAAGQVGLRIWNNSGTQQDSRFDNFGVSASNTLTGSRIAPSVSISAVGVVETSAIWWNADTPPGCTLDIQASTDGGSTYISCTNGGLIPGCEVGVDVTGKSLLIKIILTTGSLSLTPILYGLSWLVVGNFAATGSRISPALDITPANTIGASSITWAGDTPIGTTLAVDSSTDGSTFTPVVTSGDPVVGLVAQGPQVWDTFDADSRASYTIVPF
jgi:hypothetical protein